MLLAMNLSAIQAALRDRGLDAWLFYDHHHRDPIAYKVLELPELFVTRRWFYLVPANGEPAKLVHRIESGHLDTLPGSKRAYSSWQELTDNLKTIVSPYKTVAMQYSPLNMVPLIGLVDAGTIEMVRSFGVNVVTSGNLVAQFEATWTDAQIASHFAARDKVDPITDAAFKEIGRRVRNGGTHEFEIQQWIMEAFARENLDTIDPPIVAVNANSGNPHYEPKSDRSQPMKEGDFVLLDIWAKTKDPDAVYYDITWTGFIGSSPSERHREIFKIVTEARDAAIHRVTESICAGEKLAGFQVDDAARQHIAKAGYGQYFVHRTGHSIGSADVHGNGANMDNLETKDEREVQPNSCFSIEPGIYLPEFGVRSEVNMLVRPGSAEVTGRIQRELVLI
jgi:Xaa-Pro dipeptidase